MLAAIANTFSNCFKIPELKSRILFTFMLLAICRLEAIIRVPGLNGNVLAEFFKSHACYQQRRSDSECQPKEGHPLPGVPG